MPPQDPGKILVVITGGTIDAEPYIKTPERVQPLSQSMIPSLITALGYTERCTFLQWAMKDSQDFSPAEMQRLAQRIQESGCKHAVVTHGTDTMVKNAAIVQDALCQTDIQVRFVGAMEPLMHGERSDGPQNMKLALEDLTQGVARPKNVYIVGRGMQADGCIAAAIYDPATSFKDKEKKLFVDEGESSTTRRV